MLDVPLFPELLAVMVAEPAATPVTTPLAFTVATLRSTTSPDARHLIFALTFYSVLLALPLVTT